MVKSGIFEGIYQSEQGRTGRNTGYVKIGCRQDGWHLKIDIRGVYGDTACALEVSYFICMDLKTYIFPVGAIIVKNGVGQAEFLLKDQGKLPENYRFEHADGLYIGDWQETGTLLTAVWDHAENQQHRRERYQEQTEEREEKSKKTGNVWNVEKPELKKAEEKSSPQTLQPGRNAPRKEPLPFTLPREARKERQDNQIQKPEIKTAEVFPQIQMIPTRREKTLIERFEAEESKDIFNDDEFTDCMEITPQQLQEMTGVESPMAGNSFLLHAYFKYHHILLARPTDPKKENMVFIGAPGIYSNRERYLASLFGLRNFKKSHRSDYNNPNFGYWYAEIYI